MNTYNDIMMPNGAGPSLQQDFHRFSPSNNNPLDLPYSHDLFMSSSPAGQPSPQQQSMPQNRHMNVMQQPPQPSQATMHQVNTKIEFINKRKNNQFIENICRSNAFQIRSIS
jgi:hypothetical protein